MFEKTRSEWLAECKGAWRQLMATICESPREVAAGAHVAPKLAFAVMRGDRPNCRARTRKRLIAAIRRFQGDAAATRETITCAEMMHTYYAEMGGLPSYHVCALCSAARRKRWRRRYGDGR